MIADYFAFYFEPNHERLGKLHVIVRQTISREVSLKMSVQSLEFRDNGQVSSPIDQAGGTESTATPSVPLWLHFLSLCLVLIFSAKGRRAFNEFYDV